MLDVESLSAADRIIQTVLTYSDHAFHGRPGFVVPDPKSVTGVRWSPVTHKVEGDKKVVYVLSKAGKKTTRTKLGTLQENNQIKSDTGALVGEYRPAGLFPEVVTWMYRQIAEVWKLDNEFAARWASYAYGQDHRDLKVILAAFMLAQSRKGDPVIDAGKVAFYDEDYRDVGEAMLLTQRKDGKDLNPKLVLRVRDVLRIPGVAQINRELGFGKSARKPFLGRWNNAAEKWLRYREDNPKLLEGLVKAGFRTTGMNIARFSHFCPQTNKFFETLRWKQTQAKDGRRKAIGQEFVQAETWEGLDERAICQRIVREKLGFKRIVGLVPKEVGLTRAIVAAAIESGAMSDKDLIIATPTLEDLGLLQVQDIRERWEKAVKTAEDMRAVNIATRVRSKATQEKLQEASDNALKKAVGEVVKDMRVYVFVDISGSMQYSIVAAMEYIAKFLQGFPLDKMHVSVFNTSGRGIYIKHASAAGVENAFRGIMAGGGTDYGAGIRALQHHRPLPNEDVLFVFIGDEEAQPFANAVMASKLNPVAFGFLKIVNAGALGFATRFVDYSAVRTTAEQLGIPCFMIDKDIFADPYAIPRTIRSLISATPVNQITQTERVSVRQTLIDTILKTELLRRPAWAV